MLKTKVSHTTNKDSFSAGKELATNAIDGLDNAKVMMLYSSVDYDLKELIDGIKSETDIPVVGCTSSGCVMTQEGIISGSDGFAAAMVLDDSEMNIGVAGMKKENDARATGQKIALKALENAGVDYAPTYFYMTANPAEEESYLKGIQDVIGVVPFFGGTAADNAVAGDWNLYCDEDIFNDGCAVAFLYTDKYIETIYTGAYEETDKRGIVTKVNGNRDLAEIDGVKALDKYAEWSGLSSDQLSGGNLLANTILHPLGVKDPIGSVTLIRHPMVGNNNGSMSLGSDVVVGTCVNMMSTTVDKLIKSNSKTLEELNKSVEQPAGYFLVHCGGRKLAIGDREDEILTEIKSKVGDTPFITIFTFGEYGANDHSANSCGGLMLSFTAFERN